MSRIMAVSLSIIAVGALRFGWVWWERRQGDLQMERSLAARHGRVALPAGEEDAPGVKITQFYAASAEVIEGEPLTICYGVRNAQAVRLEPAVVEVWPSPNRCFSDQPLQNTRYTLYAKGGDGSEDTISFDIRTKPAPPSVLFASAQRGPIHRGEPAAFCYGVAHATSVRLDPVMALPVSTNHCVQFHPPVTRKYTLVVSGPGGEKRSESFT